MNLIIIVWISLAYLNDALDHCDQIKPFYGK